MGATKLHALAAAALLVTSHASPAAEAVRPDGAWLLAYCEHVEKADVQAKSNPFRAGQCIGFITGTLKGWEAAATVRNMKPNYCIRPGVKLDDILSAVLKYVRADPGRQAAQAEMLVISAVQQAFPCAPGELK